MSVLSNADAVAADLLRTGIQAGVRAHAVTRHFGQLLESAVKRNASLPRTAPRGPGTGGPRLITGNYVRSINLEMGGMGLTASVGTNAPQGRRLELGFNGTDSLGRRYNQPPYPHFGPALDQVSPAFVAAIAALAVA